MYIFIIPTFGSVSGVRYFVSIYSYELHWSEAQQQCKSLCYFKQICILSGDTFAFRSRIIAPETTRIKPVRLNPEEWTEKQSHNKYTYFMVADPFNLHLFRKLAGRYVLFFFLPWFRWGPWFAISHGRVSEYPLPNYLNGTCNRSPPRASRYRSNMPENMGSH